MPCGRGGIDPVGKPRVSGGGTLPDVNPGGGGGKLPCKKLGGRTGALVRGMPGGGGGGGI